MTGSRVERARKVQEELRKNLTVRPLEVEKVTRVCGLDVSYLGSKEALFATAVVMTYPDLEVVERVWVEGVADFPYIPGYLAFREAPVLLSALKELESPVDVLCVDGHGIAHPRRFGIASHVGVLSGIPSVGIAKKKLVGEYVDPPDERGAYTVLSHMGEVVGAVLRTRKGVKPVYISPGHLSDVDSAVRFVISVTGKYRIPEPVRQAHMLAVRVRREWKGKGTLK